jgi:hypothetical protein
MTGWLILLTACSIIKATEQPEKKDLSVLKPGVSRMAVVSELGLPVKQESKNGGRTELYRFRQGYSEGAKLGRAVFHGTADVFTFGLWEVVGVPIEQYFSGEDTAVLVTYNSSDRVEAVEYFKGDGQGN